jgi:hypothetical protein
MQDAAGSMAEEMAVLREVVYEEVAGNVAWCEAQGMVVSSD